MLKWVLKSISKKKVIIVEEFLPHKKTNGLANIKKKIINYFCNTNFYNENHDLFSLEELKVLMRKNKFKLIKKFIDDNILVGVFKTN